MIAWRSDIIPRIMYPIKTFILGILKILENLNKGKIIDILGKKTEVNILKKILTVDTTFTSSCALQLSTKISLVWYLLWRAVSWTGDIYLKWLIHVSWSFSKCNKLSLQRLIRAFSNITICISFYYVNLIYNQFLYSVLQQ